MRPEARAELVARASYGRLVAMLAARTGDIAAAEDALSSAFVAALEHWPIHGIPENPEGWLMQTAKNRATDAWRRAAHSPVIAVDELPDVEDMMQMGQLDGNAIPDERLALMFVCAHPAIDEAIHTPLMLQVVLGFEAADIGRSYLTAPSALAQRLVRAKRKIKLAGIAFALPQRSDMQARLPAVLEAIYGAYALDWLRMPDERDISEEACYLARLLAELLPQEAEVLGLAALITYAHARRGARVRAGTFVPLHEQDCNFWNTTLIAEADRLLARAFACSKPGRFQIEAAIQQAHVKRGETGLTDWPAILLLSEGLCRLWPTRGADVSRAAALAEVHGPEAGLTALSAISGSMTEPFQAYEATRAHLLAKSGRHQEAAAAYERAIALTPEPALRHWLEGQKAGLRHS